MNEARCEHCQNKFMAKRAWQRFCSPACRNSHHYAQRVADKEAERQAKHDRFREAAKEV